MHNFISRIYKFNSYYDLRFYKDTNGERRLIDGQDVKTNKRYMAYLLQAKSSVRNYDAWLCGGAIVNRWLILTSAACVEDVQNMYAIAGIEKYIKSDQLESNTCTQAWKRKVVFTCVPAIFDMHYNQVEKWSYDDIALVKVEKPFLFTHNSDWKECTYSPAAIPINFDTKYEDPGTEAIVLGWGHMETWRSQNSTVDYNQNNLQYTSVSILATNECKNYFKAPDMGKQIDDFMICTYHDGKLDESGKPIASRKYYDNGVMSNGKSKDTRNPSIIEGKEITNTQEHRKYWEALQRNGGETAGNLSRRKGICQNDHGGPLVTWINGTEHVIGIASVFRVDVHTRKCIGPFLYTSTAKNKEFIKCILKDLIHTDNLRRSTCDQPANGKALIALRRYIEWTHDSADVSTAPNRNIKMRPQIPMTYYRGK